MTRRTTTLLFLSTFLFSACSAGRFGTDTPWWRSGGAELPATRFQGITRSSQYITMPDGVRIAADIYLPEGLPPGEKVPTILLQTRYYRSFSIRFPFSTFLGRGGRIADHFVKNGYAVVAIDVRGSGASFGTVDAPWSPAEVRDGDEMIQWITKQPWSDGKVGAYGRSYDGTAAEMLVTQKHPALRASIPSFALFDCYSDVAFPGGIHLNWFTRNWSNGNDALDSGRPGRALGFVAGLILSGAKTVDEDRSGRLLDQAIAEHEQNHNVFQDMLRITYREDTTERGYTFADVCPFGFVRELNESKVPLLSYSGWFDGAYPNAAIKRFLSVRTPGSRLVLGPWDHGGEHQISDFSPGTKPSFPHAEFFQRFFDYHLKGMKNGLEKERPVHYFTMGEERWKAADTWPPPGLKRVNVFLSEGGALSFQPPKGGDAAADKYLVDYSAGTGTSSRWNSLFNNDGVHINYRNREREDRKLLVYDSAPLAVDTEVTGNPIANIYVASSLPDAALFVYLEDVWPDGSVHYVTEGQLRALHRKESRDTPFYQFSGLNRSFSRDDARNLTPGVPEELRFELIATSYLFKKGHRIRIAVAGADHDHFAFVPKNPPTLHIGRSPRYPSRIELPAKEVSP